MSKIIQFPNMKLENKLRKINGPHTHEKQTTSAVQNVTNEVVGELMYMLYEAGYELEDDKYITDVSLIYDSIRSLLLSVENIKHPYQDFSKMIYGNQDGEISFDLE